MDLARLLVILGVCGCLSLSSLAQPPKQGKEPLKQPEGEIVAAGLDLPGLLVIKEIAEDPNGKGVFATLVAVEKLTIRKLQRVSKDGKDDLIETFEFKDNRIEEKVLCKFLDLDGQELNFAQVKARLKAFPTLAIGTPSGKLDPVYKSVLRPEAMIVLPVPPDKK